MLKEKLIWDPGLLVGSEELKERPTDAMISYSAGGFGLSEEPDGVPKSKKKKNADETEVTILKEKEMVFFDDNDIQQIIDYNCLH